MYGRLELAQMILNYVHVIYLVSNCLYLLGTFCRIVSGTLVISTKFTDWLAPWVGIEDYLLSRFIWRTRREC